MRLWTFAAGALGAATMLPLAGTTPALGNEPAAEDRIEQYSVGDTPIGILLDDPAARAILEKEIPSLTGPRSAMVRSLSLRAVQGYSSGALSDALLDRIDAQFEALPPVRMKGPPPRITTDGARVRPYTLPDPLVMADGTRVTDAATWTRKRRPDLLRLFQTQIYGRSLGRPADQRFDILERGAPALGGSATRRQVRIHLVKGPDAPAIHLVEYLPAQTRGPVPMVVIIGFSAPSAMSSPTSRAARLWGSAGFRAWARARCGPAPRIGVSPPSSPAVRASSGPR